MAAETFARLQLPEGPRYVRRTTQGGWAVLSHAPWQADAVVVRELLATQTIQYLVPSAASKVVAIGQNYAKHAAEMGKVVPVEPLIFMKPSTALNPHGAPIVCPAASEDVHYEAELALVIGHTLKNASLDDAAKGIFAVTCFNDVTARDIQKREVQHTRAKSYDTFACCGPVMVRGLDVADVSIQCRVNGQLRQDGRTSDMVHGPAKLVSFISHIMTLLPGDIISTGTPSGVGRLVAGDVAQVSIEGIGVLENPVTR